MTDNEKKAHFLALKETVFMLAGWLAIPVMVCVISLIAKEMLPYALLAILLAGLFGTLACMYRLYYRSHLRTISSRPYRQE